MPVSGHESSSWEGQVVFPRVAGPYSWLSLLQPPLRVTGQPLGTCTSPGHPSIPSSPSGILNCPEHFIHTLTSAWVPTNRHYPLPSRYLPPGCPLFPRHPDLSLDILTSPSPHLTSPSGHFHSPQDPHLSWAHINTFIYPRSPSRHFYLPWTPTDTLTASSCLQPCGPAAKRCPGGEEEAMTHTGPGP